ncbi:MAG: PEGA domain-containing protein [Chitinispirillaceae bacterium]
MDGKMIGKTNVDKLNIKSGTHTMRFVKGAKEVEKQMTFKPGDNPSQMVRIP